MDEEKEIKRLDIVYYARIMPSVGLYEVIELKVRTVGDDFFVGTEKTTKHSYMLSQKDIDKIVFYKRSDALKMVKEAEKNGKKVSDEKYYEEY